MHREKRRGAQTRAVHAGEGPDPVTGASAPNIVMSTTFAVEEPVSFSAQDMSEETPYLYTRWANPTVRGLAEKIAALEEAEACACFGSGMAASAAVLLGLLGHGDHLVVSDTNYAGTAELVRGTLPRLGIAVTPVDTSDAGAVAAALRPETRMVWIETPANPILRLSDIAAIADVARSAGALLAVDSTFATPIATRPIALGADLVVHSLTKYFCGHGDAMGGAVAARADLVERLTTDALVHQGGVLSPFNAWLIARGTATLPLRMRAHEAGALAVARFLEDHPRVERVVYPGLESHPQHALARRQMENFSGMLTLRVADGPGTAERMMRELEVFHYAVSLGHHRSLVYWLATDDLMRSSFALDGAQREAYERFAGTGVFRVSIGLEDPDDLCADLERVLD